MLLNADIGEGLASDKLLFPYLDQANIACGSHAGNHRSMSQAVTACVEHNIMICLLYTSPSPRDLSTSRMPSSA